jgi:hypothetical protein
VSDAAAPDPTPSGTSSGFVALPPLLLAGLLGRGALRRRRGDGPMSEIRLWSS